MFGGATLGGIDRTHGMFGGATLSSIDRTHGMFSGATLSGVDYRAYLLEVFWRHGL